MFFIYLVGEAGTKGEGMKYVITLELENNDLWELQGLAGLPDWISKEWAEHYMPCNCARLPVVAAQKIMAAIEKKHGKQNPTGPYRPSPLE